MGSTFYEELYLTLGFSMDLFCGSPGLKGKKGKCLPLGNVQGSGVKLEMFRTGSSSSNHGKGITNLRW